MFRSNPYGPEIRWKIVAAGILTLLALGVGALKFFAPKPLSVSWDTEKISPGSETGGSAVLYVTVRNTEKEIAENVVVFVSPISPYLHVFSAQYLDTNTGDPRVFVIPRLAPGDTAVAKYLVKAEKGAYAGDHALKVSAAFPGATYQILTRIRVV